MKLLSQSQMREMDRRTIEGGRPGLELMEIAGRGLLRSILRRGLGSGGCGGSIAPVGPAIDSPRGRTRSPAPAACGTPPIWILCGKGNNGGDGLVLARLLRERGLWPHLFLACDPSELTGDAQAQIPLVIRSGMTLERPTERDWARFGRLGRDAIVVDALLGTGISGAPRGELGEWVARIGASRARVVAVDIPSGLSGDEADVTWGNLPEGEDPGTAVPLQASWTVTMGFLKRSFPFPPMRGRLGPVDVIDLGFSDEIVDSVGWDAELPEPDELASWLPDPSGRSHKGQWGKLVVAGGSPGLSGAAILATQAALRTGVGLVRACLPRSQTPFLDGAVSLAMSSALPEGEDGQILARGAEEILARYATWDALVVGPGLGRWPEAQRFVMKLLGGWRGPLLLDADALFALAEWGADSWVPRARDVRAGGRPGGLVLTPHHGEMARLIGRKAESWRGDPIATAREWAERWGVTLVLKGAPTVTATPDGRVWVNPSGHSGLSTGGSGDVLSGTIGALLAQGLDGPRAAALGSYLHGRAAEIGTRGARRSLLPTDVIEALPATLLSVERAEAPEDWRWHRSVPS